ncbi:PREDICTED: 4-hydroxybutyrate coenzyme A transferase-like [Polistes canadensis]|uniref:4-hydroxybutyrate coenzyme A transferase-like n=1 Tax=Polistes canadensis TaxID=91411 RepID=UPI000718EC2D|nr:PREDICTED: 4-hydroxybutyrate coenzyme A transferase-like [Polistes canadensis]XP_014604421.1 PREDICTED: 4-hydroxybutyrate coenzyme A transferase-like [Polistes canadensis]
MAAIKRLTGLTKALTSMTTSTTRISCLPAIKKNYFTYVNEPSMPIPGKEPCWLKTADEAIEQANLDSDQIVFTQGAAATPIELLRAMTDYGVRCDVRNVRLYHMHLEGPAPFALPENAKHFRSVSLFIGGNVRKAVNQGNADCIPICLHEIPKLFKRGYIKPDIALIHVSPPDSHGYCSLGTSVDCVRSAMSNSKQIIALVNKHMPRTFGDGIIHISHIDFAVQHDVPLPTHPVNKRSKEEDQIGKNIAENLVVDGATLQMGIGSIPDAVLSNLTNHKDLGIHSEMFSDGVLALVNKGCITNNQKSMHKGRIVGSFCIGTEELYKFMHDNPFIEMLMVDYVNDPKVISRQPKMTAINSCIEVDITGQICSDSIGTRMYSGFGGQLDFISGAAMSDDGCGKPIIALQSLTKKGESKILPILKSGAGVVTNRAIVRYVVTEQGIAYLFGKSLQQRAYELIKIAHPNHREALEKAAFERLKVMPAP